METRPKKFTEIIKEEHARLLAKQDRAVIPTPPVIKIPEEKRIEFIDRQYTADNPDYVTPPQTEEVTPIELETQTPEEKIFKVDMGVFKYINELISRYPNATDMLEDLKSSLASAKSRESFISILN